jgi:hypothetical protein
MNGESQWERLERYARWKQNRLRLDLLSSDVLSVVCRFLPNESVSNLFAALRGLSLPLNISCANDMNGIAVELHRHWFRRVAYECMETQLSRLIAHTCYYCTDSSLQVHAFADWSMFQKFAQRPIAEYFYGYNNKRPEWMMRVNNQMLVNHVNKMCTVGICATRISLYITWVGTSVTYMFPNELYSIMLNVFPHTLIDFIK